MARTNERLPIAEPLLEVELELELEELLELLELDELLELEELDVEPEDPSDPPQATSVVDSNNGTAQPPPGNLFLFLCMIFTKILPAFEMFISRNG